MTNIAELIETWRQQEDALLSATAADTLELVITEALRLGAMIPSDEWNVYEWRVVTKDGRWRIAALYDSVEKAERIASGYDEEFRMDAPHRVQRRVHIVGEWGNTE